jgi:hypothetical protein
MKRMLILLAVLTAIICAATANSGWMDKSCDKRGDMPMMGAMGFHHKERMDHCQNSMMYDGDHANKQKMGHDHKFTVGCICKCGKMKGMHSDDMKMNQCDNPIMRHGMGQKDKEHAIMCMCTCKLAHKGYPKSDDPADPPEAGAMRDGERFEGREGGFGGAEFGEGGFGEREGEEFNPYDVDDYYEFMPGFYYYPDLEDGFDDGGFISEGGEFGEHGGFEGHGGEGFEGREGHGGGFQGGRR